jgi:hypothetical protein
MEKTKEELIKDCRGEICLIRSRIADIERNIDKLASVIEKFNQYL